MLALLTGEDAWAAEQALGEMEARLSADGAPAETWRVSGNEVDVVELGDRLATQPLFGGGTLAVIDDPGPLLRATVNREQLAAAMDRLAPGNGLAFLALDDARERRPAWLDHLRDVVTEHHGTVTSFKAPTLGRMQEFIRQRAAAMAVDIDPAAARLLGERVGGWVSEGDVDRRWQAQLAVGELEKLALYRPDTRIGEEDVRALVSEAVPGSAWGFLDAVGARRVDEAARLLDRLLADGTPLPRLVVQLHRRLRQLVEVREHLDAGEPPEALPRALKIKPYSAQKLAEQARSWSLDDLQRAIDALFELDVAIKGLEDVTASEPELELAFELWLTDRIRRS